MIPLTREQVKLLRPGMKLIVIPHDDGSTDPGCTYPPIGSVVTVESITELNNIIIREYKRSMGNRHMESYSHKRFTIGRILPRNYVGLQYEYQICS